MAESELKGLDEVINNLNKEIKKIKGRSQAGLYLGGQHIRRESQKQCPVVTGNMKNSAFVVSPEAITGSQPAFKGKQAGDMKSQHAKVVEFQQQVLKNVRTPAVAVGYSALYAPIVHENPRAGAAKWDDPSYKAPSAGLTESGKKSKRITAAEGGKYKFLEDPIKSEQKMVFDIIKKKAKIK